jgi:hypothetical protein
VDRSLTAAQLARLLARLDPDPNRAAEAYESLRRALVRFFDWRGASTPDLCADDTIDRLARRLDETAVNDVRSYAHGVARLVLLEHQRQPAFESLGNSDLPATLPDSDDEDIQHCFERCLDRLAPSDRELAVAYYEGERSSRIANRRRLAQARGLSENALRLRVGRLRDQLERCIEQCLQKQ